MIDTQILSYAYKGQRAAVDDAKVSSVVAHEFLEIYDAKSPTKFHYYIRYAAGGSVNHQRWLFGDPPAKLKPGWVEKLILNFGADFPSLIEFHSRATSAIINDRNIAAFGQILSSLDKPAKKRLRPRFAFICRHIEACVPLVPKMAEVGIQLLWDFSQKHSLKANFRNSVNDMMILATAITAGERFWTEDSLLARFAADCHYAPLREVRPGIIEIDFEKTKASTPNRSRESKGYINRGWRIATDLGRSPVR